MAQITHGIRAILSNSFFYTAFQSIMGAHKSRQRFVKNWVKSYDGMSILDIGCGPADILEYLPGVDYYGFDISEVYIERAKERFGVRGQFYCKELEFDDLVVLPKFDVVLALGLLHHLDDAVAQNVLQISYEALRPGGRLLTIDPCLDPTQSAVARFLIRNDRGQNVRDKQEYKELTESYFESPRVEVCHQVWIPYTHCFMECQK
jgi:SAM-dependent methyltransferase